MKMVYANESAFLVNSMKVLLEAKHIPVFLKNEFALGAVGEISPFDGWPELWVVNDEDCDKAISIIEAEKRSKGSEDWICNHCLEKNAPSFEVCWQCQKAMD